MLQQKYAVSELTRFRRGHTVVILTDRQAHILSYHFGTDCFILSMKLIKRDLIFLEQIYPPAAKLLIRRTFNSRQPSPSVQLDKLDLHQMLHVALERHQPADLWSSVFAPSTPPLRYCALPSMLASSRLYLAPHNLLKVAEIEPQFIVLFLLQKKKLTKTRKN